MITKEATVTASLAEVWQLWTTSEGARTFFAPEARIELAIGGAYELYFDSSAPAGLRGSEGCKVLSYLPMEMLSFSWNAPPQFPTVRCQYTWVVVQIRDIGDGRVKVALSHLGWCEGEEWNKVYDYFDRAWGHVLGWLEKRLTTGPLDWRNP
jgi:uncharacterized protein YndB with AHSA1/START domain